MTKAWHKIVDYIPHMLIFYLVFYVVSRVITVAYDLTHPCIKYSGVEEKTSFILVGTVQIPVTKEVPVCVERKGH